MNIKTKLLFGIGILAGMIILLVTLSVVNLQILTATEPDSPVAMPALERALLWISVTGGICILTGLVLLIWLPRSINRPVKELTCGILEIANHNYEKRLDMRGYEEFREVSDSFNRMAEKLTEYRDSTLADILSAKKFLEAVVNSIHEPIIGLNTEREILFINNEALNVLNMKRENVIRKSAEELSLKNDLLRRLIRELVTPGEKNEPLKIYADNKESYFQASYIPIENAAAEEGEARNLGDVILLKNITEFKEIKQMEYDAITHHNDPAYASNKKHFKAEEDSLPAYLKPYFSRVIRITRLREVKVLLGFTRVDAPDPDADVQANVVYLNKGKSEKWLPAAEVNGEGVFIEFNKETLEKWLAIPSVKALSRRYEECYEEFCNAKGWTLNVKRNATYVLMHTFAHLLIKQMSMTSGYSSSAIRERIYFSEKMTGILLYTGSADKEGSLGGLVELGNIGKLVPLMKGAFQEALLCTNDPECMSNAPAGNNLNGAACHSCCMISETACENGNRMLDRGLVVPIACRERESYFRELVCELCQLEM